jgi:hypothetical protein
MRPGVKLPGDVDDYPNGVLLEKVFKRAGDGPE